MTEADHRRAVVEVADVTVEYGGPGGTRALESVSLSLAAATFSALVGPSGSGKSTLLQVVGGLQRPTSGTVRVGGIELGALSDDDLADIRRTRVGLVFQFFNLFPTMSAWENVAVPAVLGGARPSRVRGRAMELLAAVDMEARAERRPGQLSGGEMQRVAIARAMMLDPLVVLADEPTGNLDSAAGELVLNALAGVARDGAGRVVLMATHDATGASRAHTVVRLRDGRLGPPREVG